MATLGTPIAIVAGNKRLTIVKYTGPSSYATGGDPIPLAALGMSSVDVILAIPVTVGNEVIWNGSTTAPKMQWVWPQGGSASGSNSGDGKVASGATTVTSTAAQADVDSGANREVAAGTNLSAQSVYLLAVGS